MAGESPNHGRICTNLTRIRSTQLLGSPCEVFSKDTKVRSGPAQAHTRAGLWSYPDLVIVCGQGQYHDQYQDVLLNPRMLVEVLSPSTAKFDRGEKWDRYRTWLPSVQDYVLVAQDAPRVEHWHRLEDKRLALRHPARPGRDAASPQHCVPRAAPRRLRPDCVSPGRRRAPRIHEEPLRGLASPGPGPLKPSHSL